MSRAATDWAWDQPLKPASLKILLLSMADRADECHQCYPSIPRLVKDTSLDKKTVQGGIVRLQELGYVTDTGERRGPTRRVRVFQLNLQRPATDTQTNVPKNGQIQTCPTTAANVPPNAPANAPANAPKIGNIPNNGNIPTNGQLNDPEIGKLNDPENGIQNQSLEPIIESKSRCGTKTGLDFSSWPACPSDQILKDWVAVRKEHRAPLTQTAVDRLAAELRLAADAGVSVDECLGTAVELGWRGFRFAWYQNAQNRGQQPVQHAGGRQEPDWDVPAFPEYQQMETVV